MNDQIRYIFENEDFETTDYLSEIGDVMRYTMRQLQQIFDRREALPTETLPDGSSLLHVSSHLC